MINYNNPPKCPRCSNVMRRANLEIWGSTELPNAWTCHVKECPVYTITWIEGQKNTYDNYLKRKVKY